MDGTEHIPSIIDALGNAPPEVYGLLLIGIVVMVGGIAYWLYQTHKPTASATTGGLANTGTIGTAYGGAGAARDQMIGVVDQRQGVSEEALLALLQDRGDPTALARQLGMAEAALDPILRHVNRQDIDPREWATAVADYVREFNDLKQQVRTLGGNDPALKAYEEEAEQHLDAGRLDDARTALGQLAAARLERADKRADEASQEYAHAARAFNSMAEAAELDFDFKAAAQHYASAVDAAEKSSDSSLTWGYRIDQAQALGKHGDRRGDNAALEQAIALLRSLLSQGNRASNPKLWAMTQNNLGNALSTLGQRESGTARLEEAIAAYTQALKEHTRDRVPLDWAMTQNNLGNALSTLGQRESGTARLEDAVAAYTQALEERTRDRVPLDWAMTQNNLGNALASLGERETGTARLEEAVAAYTQALKEVTRDRVPLDWAMTQNNLGNALRTLGQRESGTARLEEAVAAYTQALEERTRDRAPLDWAGTNANFARTLLVLGSRTKSEAVLREGRERVLGALEVFEAAGHPFAEPAQAILKDIDTALADLGSGSSASE